MGKKRLGLTILLLTAAIFINGCGKKLSSQSKAVNDPISDQNQEQTQEQNQNQEQIQNPGNPPAIELENVSGDYSINELLTMNKPLKCTWKESITQGGEVTNILYIDGKSFYQDVTMGDLGHAYTISDGEYLYIWSDFNAVASKFKFAGMEPSAVPGQEKTEGTAALEQKRDFICEHWSADPSIFNPPQDKNFQDITEEVGQFTQELQEGGQEEILQQICDLCQKAPNQETRNACLINAGCSQ